MSPRVLIADDQQLVRTGFRLILDSEADIEVVGEATNGREAVTMAAGIDELTPRELEVFRLVAKGISNAEIANQLVIGETTVKTHVTRVLMKLGVRDRVQAVVLAHEAGIVSPSRHRSTTAGSAFEKPTRRADA